MFFLLLVICIPVCLSDRLCWEDGESLFSFEMCCNGAWGQSGHNNCWGGDFTFERCCVFHSGGGNEVNLPIVHNDMIHIASDRPHSFTWHLRQNRTSGWHEQIPGMLWKQGYAMLRWFEDLPDDAIRGKQILELGSGIGLLSLHLALRGGWVTATDGSPRALMLGRINAEANLPLSIEWNHLTWRLVRWEEAQSVSDMQELGLAPPYEVIVCSALLYAPTSNFRQLVRLLWASTNEDSVVLWGSGVVNKEAQIERFALLSKCFVEVELIDAVEKGYTVVPNTTMSRLRRREQPISVDVCVKDQLMAEL